MKIKGGQELVKSRKILKKKLETYVNTVVELYEKQSKKLMSMGSLCMHNIRVYGKQIQTIHNQKKYIQ